jgi:hypothetical protein
VVTVTGGQQHVRLRGRADGRQSRAAAPAHLRVHVSPRSRGDKRKGFTEADYSRLLDAAHQQLGSPIVLVWDNSNTHVSKAMARLVAARAG